MKIDLCGNKTSDISTSKTNQIFYRFTNNISKINTLNNLSILTCPFLSISLLVSLTFSKETTCFLSCSPVKGESGWAYSRHGAGGSAFPATSHEDLWYAYRYLLLSTGTISSNTAYLCSGRTPVKDTLNVGNILLQREVKGHTDYLCLTSCYINI